MYSQLCGLALSSDFICSHCRPEASFSGIFCAFLSTSSSFVHPSGHFSPIFQISISKSLPISKGKFFPSIFLRFSKFSPFTLHFLGNRFWRRLSCPFCPAFRRAVSSLSPCTSSSGGRKITERPSIRRGCRRLQGRWGGRRS